MNMKLGGGKALKSDWSYNTIEQLYLMFITTGYLVDAPALWAVRDKCSRGWDVIVTNCLFLFLFVCSFVFLLVVIFVCSAATDIGV